MAAFSFENRTISKSDAIHARSNEDEERLERFLRTINRSQFNIKRSMVILDGIHVPSSS